jgi:hypothetical protein
VKGDNNLFRWVWWKLAISETWHSAPIFGLGFGYDISAQFSREYFAGMANDFTVRSPNSIFVTVFARMGLVGLSLFLGIVALMFHYTRNALISSEPHELGAWAGAWAILASASFGAVLEEPMGAIVGNRQWHDQQLERRPGGIEAGEVRIGTSIVRKPTFSGANA